MHTFPYEALTRFCPARSQPQFFEGREFNFFGGAAKNKFVCATDCLCCYSYRKMLQESLANAKGSARQPWYIVRNSLNRPPLRIAQQYQRNIVEKYFQCATIPSLTMWVYLHSFSRCSLSNMPTSAKFRKNLNVQQFKVIQGRCFWYQSKAHIRVPINH